MAEKKKKGRIRGFFSDFKAFISRGNILDMAIGIIIGGAFGKIISSLVDDIIMPLISLAVGGKSVEEWRWAIPRNAADGSTAYLNYGLFIQAIIDFLIIAFCIFMVLRVILKLKNRRMQEEGSLLTYDERKKLIKEYRLQGHSKREAVEMADKKEEEMIAAAKAEKEAAEAAAAAAEAAKETSEDILKDIRELLKNGANLNNKEN